MEEIDIIELLKRVKEGKAPKEIEIDSIVYTRNTDDGFSDYIETMYEHDEGPRCATKFWTDTFKLSTKIKILDKPIIEELKEIQYSELKYSDNIDEDYINSIIVSNRDKINEIIKFLNNKE